MLAEELVIIDRDSSLWSTAQPLFEMFIQLEQNDDSYSWHGWRKNEICTFLQQLPPHCSLLVGVWAIDPQSEGRESLVIGCVCEVKDGLLCSIRTFEALDQQTLPSLDTLEPGFQHALELMRVAKVQVAPVAWALFTDITTWNEWIETESVDGQIANKSDLIALFARQGRCVLMGNQTMHHHHK